MTVTVFSLKTLRNASLPLALLCSLTWSAATLAEQTPEGEDVVRVFTGTPANDGKNPFVFEIRWRPDGDIPFDASAFVNGHGPNEETRDDGVSLAEKMNKRINKSIWYVPPTIRGVTVEQAQEGGKLKPELIIKNRAGFSILHVTIIDYTGQKLTIDTGGSKSFSENRVDFGLDIAGSPKGGKVEFGVDGKSPATITPSSADQVESEIVGKIPGGKISTATLVIDLGAKDNIIRDKPFFDGKEVQSNSLSAKAVNFQVADQGMWSTSKLLFPDENKGSRDLVRDVFVGATFIILLYFCWLYLNSWLESRKKRSYGARAEGDVPPPPPQA